MHLYVLKLPKNIDRKQICLRSTLKIKSFKQDHICVFNKITNHKVYLTVQSKGQAYSHSKTISQQASN